MVQSSLANDQTNEMDFIDDIVHEIAHSIEKKYVNLIYGDGAIEKEFKTKRKKLYDILKEKEKTHLLKWSQTLTLANHLMTISLKKLDTQ